MMTSEEMQHAIITRASEIVAKKIAERIETQAQAEADRVLLALESPPGEAGTRTGITRHRVRAVVTGRFTLMRGATLSLPSKKDTLQYRAARLTWDSLHADGHFASGRVRRDDLFAYLQASFPDERPNSLNSAISKMLSDETLVVAPAGF